MNREPLNLINGKIITLNDSIPMAENLTIKNGKIYSIDKPNPSFKTINLNQSTVIPGFIDAHFHITNLGKRLEMINLKKLNNPEKIVELIYKKSKELPEGEWIQGFGWDQNLWNESEFPLQEMLNSKIKNHPVFLTRIDGHCAWVNKYALKLADMDTSICSLQDLFVGLTDGGLE